MTSLQRLAIGVAVACLFALGAQPGEEVYTALRVEELVARHELNAVGRSVGGLGVGYRIEGHPELPRLESVLAVHRSVGEARQMFRSRTTLISGAPTPFDERIGDECVLWTAFVPGNPVYPQPHEKGTLLVRTHNIVLDVRWDGPVAVGVALARSLVELIDKDRGIAPLGTFHETPEIVSVDLPESCEAGQNVELHPRVRGLGDASRVRFTAVARMNILRDTPTPPPPGELKFLIPIEREEGPTRIEIIAVNDDNVFVTKVVTTNVIGGKLLPDPSTFRREKE